MDSRLYSFALILTFGCLGGAINLPVVTIAQAQTNQDCKTEGDRLWEACRDDLKTDKNQQALQDCQQAAEVYKTISNLIGQWKSLRNLGIAYYFLGKYDKAINYQLQSLEITREIKDRQGESIVLVDLGIAYYFLGKYDKAIDYQLYNLAIMREVKDRQREGLVLSHLGLSYDSLYKYDKAIEYQLQSLKIAIEIKNRSGEEYALGNLGNIYLKLANYGKAIEYFQQVLAISRQTKDRHSESRALDNLGLTYRHLGKYDKAIDYHQQSLKIAQETKNRTAENKAIGSLGVSYALLEKYDKAIEYQLQHLALAREINDQGSESNALGNLGSTYALLKKYDKAIEYQLQHLALAREINDTRGQGYALGGLGTIYQELGNYEKAIEYFQQVLVISQQIKDRWSEFISLSRIGKTLSLQNKTELAILFYKQSVNVSESIRQDLRTLKLDEQQSYLFTVEDTYRSLADLLLKQDRILEAQQVLDLLKVEELSEYLRTVRGNSETAKGTDLQKPEQNIIALSNELAELQKLDREGKLDPQQQPRLAFLTNNEIEQNKQFNAFLQSSDVQKQIQELRRIESQKNVDIEIYKRLEKQIKNLQNTALFYPLILDDRLELILIIANAPPIRKTVNLKRTELNQDIESFLRNLRNSNSEVKTDAQKFYNWLIQPFEKELQQANIQTIIYAPDEGLRYIPLAALYDGKQWLVERYRINNITAASLTDFTPHAAPSIRVLAAASTAEHNVKVGDRTLSFSALPATKIEVDNIATKINTTKLVDRDFTESALTGKLNTHNIIHLATHGHFEVGQPEQSFILLGDGKISTISDIGSWTLTNVSLVVLSACETAIGGQGGKGKGIEIFGLGYQIHNAGASAAIATLWKVSDGGTERLMDAFYTAVKTGKVSNTEALRQAQVAMITGNSEGLGESRGIVSIEARLRATATVPAKISHPYYWAAFILIGNGF